MLGLFELGARLFMEPSELAYGRLLGRELPPYRLLVSIAWDPAEPVPNLFEAGLPVTLGDLYGVHRDDPVLGYAPVESSTSERGWWQSNALGARSRTETSASRPPGMRRVLVFGESFTSGSRVPQEESWPHYLDAGLPGWEVVNLAVDGYSMSQAMLRYRLLRERVEHDVVVLGYVPRADLVREINTMRALMGWRSARLMPRFTLEDGRLAAVRSHWGSTAEMRRAVEGGDEDRLRSHLARYDSFYFDEAFELPPILGALVGYKLYASAGLGDRRAAVAADARRDGSEALALTRRVLATMAREVTERGPTFVVATIPTLRDLEPANSAPWQVMTNVCPPSVRCVDVRDALLAPDAPRDHGRDGTHWGPRTNARIAQAMRQQLVGLW
jgi:hypothetical protein